MCKCTPGIKTPWCGKLGCERPVQDPPTLHDLREAKRSLDFTLEDTKRLVSEFSAMVSRALAEPKLPPTRPDLVAAF